MKMRAAAFPVSLLWAVSIASAQTIAAGSDIFAFTLFEPELVAEK